MVWIYWFKNFMTKVSIIQKPGHWFAEWFLYDRDIRHERVNERKRQNSRNSLLFSYDANIQNEQNYLNTLLRIEQVLKLWRMRSLFLDSKITVFQSLAISTIVYLAMMTPVPKLISMNFRKIISVFFYGVTQLLK